MKMLSLWKTARLNFYVMIIAMDSVTVSQPCPTGAISFIERKAAAYDEKAVQAHLEYSKKAKSLTCGCSGTHSKVLSETTTEQSIPATSSSSNTTKQISSSQLRQWPIQMKLVPSNAPYFDNANLLIAADCSAFSYDDFHNRFMKNHMTLIGCPKLDAVDCNFFCTSRVNDLFR